MSLKARIEAVIYAAEEPVTLAQLATLFREEALLNRTSRPAPQVDASADSDSSATDEAVEQLLPSSPESVGNAESSSVTPIPAPESLETEAPPVPSSHEEPPPTAEPEPGDPEAEKKAARARDREIRDEIRDLIDELIADYSSEDHGLEIREVAGGFRFGTRPEVHDAVRGFVKSLKPPMKLSLQALETLAVIAYKQPVTAPEIGEIRGVDSAGVLGSLIARKLINTAGRKQVIGRPILYKTTREFLLRFGLKDLNELPSIEEFEKMASELEEENSPTDAEGDSLSAQDLPFARNEIAAIEEDAESSPEPGESPEPEPPVTEPPSEAPRPPVREPEPDPDSEPTPEQNPALEEHQP
ncbi:MAG TPA: SMC-Scp complex subunit ScpB [Acidobacteriaceae bacterium]|jgi:segregation and condensation protein B|nr:SMC-Scp complex subunit ScpB [Acidobacteriaceae bacterium]